MVDPVPPGPPVRVSSTDFHFHRYDYPGAKAWTMPVPPTSPAYSMVADIEALAARAAYLGVPNVVVADIGPPIPGDGGVARGIRMLSFGGAADSPVVIITGGIHAREWIAPEIAYLVAEYLIGNYAATPQGRYQRTIRQLLQTRRIHVVPIVNPNGLEYSAGLEQNARMWRKNRKVLPGSAADWVSALTTPTGSPRRPFTQVHIVDPNCKVSVPTFDPPRVPPSHGLAYTRTMPTGSIGVDLNRNFATPAYGYDCKVIISPSRPSSYRQWNPAEDLYCGPGAASEVETQSLQNLFASFGGVGASIDYHSYSKAILYPGEVAHQGGIDAAYTELGKILRRMINPPGVTADYRLGTPAECVGYDGTGILADRMVEMTQSRAFTVELDPAAGAGSAEFMLPEDQIKMVFENNIRGALALIAAAADQSADGGMWSCFSRRTYGSAVREFFDWKVSGRGNQLPTV